MLEKSNKEYERALCVADALTLGAGLMKGGAKLAIAKVVRKGALREGVARGFSKNYAKMVRHEFAELVREEIDDSAAEVVAFATGAAPLTHNVGYLVARHALGIKSKVYWFELATALYLGNWKVWLYGPEAIAEARIEKMKMEIAPHIFELRLAIELMSNQLESSIYAED